MLSTGLLMQGQIFADSHRHCAMREGGENWHFWCKKGIVEKFCPTYFTIPVSSTPQLISQNSNQTV